MADWEPFLAAIKSGDLPAVEALLAAGADPNAFAEKDYPSLLRTAIEFEHAEIVLRLVAAGASVNPQHGWAPLAHAIDTESDVAWQLYNDVSRASTELTVLLLALGAKPCDEAFRVATNYDNRHALALLEQYAART